MKQVLAFVLILVLCAGLGCPALGEEATDFTIEELDVTMILAFPGNDTLQFSEVPLVFINEDYSVPYISVESYYATVTDFMQAYVSPGFSVTCEETNEGLLCQRENGSALLFDFDAKEIYITDQDMFNAAYGAINSLDELGMSATGRRDANGDLLYDEDGNLLVDLFYRVDDGSSFSRTGITMYLSLENSNITMFQTEEGSFLPLAALNTLFHAGNTLQLVFNGNYLFALINYRLDNNATDEYGYTLADYYYDSPSTQRSETLTALNYELLCIELNLNYGLKETHGVTNEDFDTYFDAIGLKSKMLDPEGQSFAEAISELTRSYFADFHSNLNALNPYCSGTLMQSNDNLPVSSRYVEEAYERFQSARREAGLAVEGEDGEDVILEPYMEVGNTAYLTLDSFTDGLYDFYNADVQDNLELLIGEDTLALVIYAAQMINREDSPIEHVVIDLSLNGGGHVTAAEYLLSWMLGNATMSATNPTTGAQCSVTYQADINLDGIINEEDVLDLDRFDVYCLTSLNSFSCGNTVPVCAKDSGKVTLLGQTSGGGACMVQNAVTADGAIFQYSSSFQMSTVKNGSFYSVDEGADPHFYISKIAHFYDREWLNDFIENLP